MFMTDWRAVCCTINQIYYIRGPKVMLEGDLEELYVTTGNLDKAVPRNIRRFPDNFMFRLTDEEFKILLFHLEEQDRAEDDKRLMPLLNKEWQCCQECCPMIEPLRIKD